MEINEIFLELFASCFISLQFSFVSGKEAALSFSVGFSLKVFHAIHVFLNEFCKLLSNIVECIRVSIQKHRA